MKIYLVGGAVRDQLLKFPIKEKDYVVVGATPDEMLALGYKQVGKDFPVFLHPETKEEYALARTERKTGRGYTGFSFDAAPTVTLEEDLKRRDLTINAMAQTLEGELIDPYHGKKDLEQKILRHVSEAFIEDPVRILRVARFAARYAHLGFHIAPETILLMNKMVKSGEADALVAERVWKELERALAEKDPDIFFTTLADCGALSLLFPTINSYAIEALAQTAQHTEDPAIRFAVLMHASSDEEIIACCDRYRVPAFYRELALLVAEFKNEYAHVKDLSAEGVIDFLQNTDAFRREERFNKFLFACETCTGLSSQLWKKHLAAAKDIDIEKIISETGASGKALAEKIKIARMKNII